MFVTLAASKTQVQTTSVLAAIRTLKTVQNVSIVHEWYNSIQVNHTVFTRMSKFTIFQNAWMISFRVCSLCMNNWIVCHRFCLLCMNVLITVCSLCNNKTNYQLFVITLIGLSDSNICFQSSVYMYILLLHRNILCKYILYMCYQ